MTASNKQLIERPPVVVIMGHIDHGKSTLLDFVRQSNVVAGEAGGITQHISAYEVKHQTDGGPEKRITFIDTPGHAAFESTRSRGATIADVAILIVSAEEGVKAQTIEAYNSINEAGLPFAIAINKIDRPNANVERVKQELAEKNILVESYGGKIPSVAISAKTGQGVDELLDLIILMTELEELRATPDQPATGYVLEAFLDPKIGTTVTLIIKDGTLKTGDFVIVEGELAKVKRMENFLGQLISEASFSSPVKIIGFTGAPAVGSSFVSTNNKKEAEKLAKDPSRQTEQTASAEQAATPHADQIEIPLVIRADVVGTLEAVIRELNKLNSELVRLKIIGQGIGAITETDVKLATASEQPIIVGFNVKVDPSARELAERQGVPIQTFDIIYKLEESLAVEVERRRPRVTTEETRGKAKILKIFSHTGDRQVVGGAVNDGVITKGREVKIFRREQEIGRGKLVELQVQKIKAEQVEAGNQFGAMVDAKIGIAPGDVLEVFDRVEQ
jgi:translation initiation factor IF-2